MDDRERVGLQILDEGGKLMDEKKFVQAREVYRRMEYSTAPESYKEMAREFAQQAQEAADRRKRIFG